MEPIKIIVIGVGNWGKLWIENILADPNYHLTALVDESQDKLNEACSKFKLNDMIGFTSLEQAIIKVKPEAAVIVVPPENHYPAVQVCIQNNIHILSEKPLANSMEEAICIKQEAEKQGTLFMVSQDYRWQPPIQTLRKSIKEGMIGKPAYSVYRHFQALSIGGWREQMDEVILEDMAIHHFDILRYITGLDCLEIYAQSFNPSWSWYRGGATTSVLLTFENGFKVNYFATWVTSGSEDSWPGEIRMEGNKGSLFLNAKGEVKFDSKGKVNIVPPTPMELTGRSYSLSQFFNGVRNQVQPETVVSDNIKSYAMTRAALRSVHSNAPVRMEI